MNEPIADETRSILDGHIVLSRKLAAAGHYPAIDVLASISRVMGALVDEHHHEAARKLRAVLAKYAEIELLVQIGEYRKGSDAEADWALDKMARSMPFLRQGLEERPNFDTMLAELEQAVA